jgi:Ca-activated chloride channel family protein
MRRWIAVCLLLSGWPARPDTGVLLPTDQPQPDPAILSLEEMAIDIRVDNGHARVRIQQIFASHRAGVMEGSYIFALPGGAIVSDFAIWDDLTRIPGVILERKRAEELYTSIRNQVIDPGLLQQGEHDADEARRTAVFSAKIAPIRGFGTKRVEMEYTELLPVAEFESFLAIPLRPDQYRLQTAGKLTVHFEMVSAHALKDFQLVSKSYPIKLGERTPNRVKFDYEGRGVKLSEDLAVRFTLESKGGDKLEILTHRDNTPAAQDPTELTPVAVAANEPGFFEASALITGFKPGTMEQLGPKTVIALFDNSLSMQWEKLERNYQALETMLKALTPADHFNLLLFNTTVRPLQPGPIAATPDAVEQALAFVKASRLRGGTNLQSALDAGLSMASGPDTYLVLLSDGGATRGTIQNGKLAEWYAAKWKAKPQPPRTYVFAVGDDANMPLMRMLARNGGVVEWVRSTEPIDFKLKSFLGKIGRHPLEDVTLKTSPGLNLVYPLQESTFPGSVQSWVGQYGAPAARATFTASGKRDGAPVQMNATAALPAQELAHPDLPRIWAKARVDALLDKIERDGEDAASIDEIIRLSRRYKFITPYTSFLAAPRALLRPRLIRPGDPLLRVRTDASIVSVVALFPFGPVKKLQYLPDEDTWQTRFLAPSDLEDGVHRVRLVLRDKNGHVYREAKTFVIASKPPIVRVKLDKNTVRRGERLALHVSASQTTRTVTARMYGATPVSLRWNPEMGSNTGALLVPAHLAPGKYVVTVTAEDFAHNIGSQEVSIEVQP